MVSPYLKDRFFRVYKKIMCKKLTKEEFVEKAIKKHGVRFNYDKVVYKTNKISVIIECVRHNLIFAQRPSNHLNGYGGCELCKQELSRKDSKDYISEVSKIHNNFYDYSKTNYVKAFDKVTITCPLHGDFIQEAKEHYRYGCAKCGKEKASKSCIMTTNEFIQKANNRWNYKYDYSLLEYLGNDLFINIICPIHGKFKLIASRHLSQQGCQKCGKESQNKKQKENPTGWGRVSWKEHGKTSKDFESYKTYILRCWSENEEFYKIGRTFKNIHKRFKCKNDMPYEFEVIYLFETESDIAYNMEIKLKSQYKALKYIPNDNFGGRYECFTTDLPIEEIISYLEQL